MPETGGHKEKSLKKTLGHRNFIKRLRLLGTRAVIPFQ